MTIPKNSPDSMQTGAAGLRVFRTLTEMWGLSSADQIKILRLQDCSMFVTLKIRVRAYEAVTISLDIIMRIGSIFSAAVLVDRYADLGKFMEAPSRCQVRSGPDDLSR